MNGTARRFADVVLPATAWIEELGCKSTNTHLYLMPKVLEPPGETRPVAWVLKELASRLGVDDFYPWENDEGPIDAILDHPATGHATVAALRAEDGIRSEEHTSELQSPCNLVCRLLLEKKKKTKVVPAQIPSNRANLR